MKKNMKKLRAIFAAFMVSMPVLSYSQEPEVPAIVEETSAMNKTTTTKFDKKFLQKVMDHLADEQTDENNTEQPDRAVQNFVAIGQFAVNTVVSIAGLYIAWKAFGSDKQVLNRVVAMQNSLTPSRMAKNICDTIDFAQQPGVGHKKIASRDKLIHILGVGQ